MPSIKAGPTGKGSERRRETRQQTSLTADAILLRAAGTPVFPILARDLSTHGIGFEGDREFFLGEYFAVALRLPNQVGKLLLCATRYCCLTGTKRFEVGAELIESISLDKSGINIPARWLEKAREEKD